MIDQLTPYRNLSPELILSAVESLGIFCTGSLLSLNSYENRVYQVGVEDNVPLVVKFYRPHRWSNEAILEEHHFAFELAQHDIPVVPPLLFSDKTLHEYMDYRFAVFPRQGGRMLELDNDEHLEWMGRLIGRIHAVGASHDFNHRLTLTLRSHGEVPSAYLLEQGFIPEDMRHNYSRVVAELLEKSAVCFERAGESQSIRLHGDCHAGNVLWNADGPRIVDLDDCLMGPAIQDIWMLLSGSHDDRKRQLRVILDGYYQFHDLNPTEFILIEALRTLRMIHYAGWLAKRWDDPAFPLHFPWFNTHQYWQEQLQHLREQSAVLDDVLDK